jgi:hypothetical protein
MKIVMRPGDVMCDRRGLSLVRLHRQPNTTTRKERYGSER